MADGIRVTKLEAARRQLSTAIDLWFADADVISIHALAYASHEIIHRLFRLKGHSDLLYDTSFISDADRPRVNNLLKHSGNFIKHANIEKNPDAVLDFVPLVSEIYMLMSVEGLRRMGEALSTNEVAFAAYQHILHPEYFGLSIFKQPIPPETLEKLRSISRREFLEYFIKNRIWG